MKGFNFDFVKMVEDKEKAIKNEMRYCIKRALELRCSSVQLVIDVYSKKLDVEEDYWTPGDVGQVNCSTLILGSWGYGSEPRHAGKAFVKKEVEDSFRKLIDELKKVNFICSPMKLSQSRELMAFISMLEESMAQVDSVVTTETPVDTAVLHGQVSGTCQVLSALTGRKVQYKDGHICYE